MGKGETIIGSFYDKELLLSNLQMSYYTERDSQIKDIVKIVLDLSNYATKKNMLQVLIDLLLNKIFLLWSWQTRH